MEIKNQIDNIILIGFMGTGKSTVGKELVEQLGWDFVDTDVCIVEEAGMTIPEIFERFGEAHFRDLEHRVLAKVLEQRQQIVSTGGGAVLREENRTLMGSKGMVVALTATKETIFDRVKQDENRPLLQGGAWQKIEALLKEREHAYSFANLTIATDDLDKHQIAKRIMQACSI
ncbi:shikimate kinase [Marinicrinis sediminis]|uniref:Shikimate kinase n=1 Tax=Marinicrinis sediminis TaxID=1652465 RepID=A0ABW5R669_9BACL